MARLSNSNPQHQSQRSSTATAVRISALVGVVLVAMMATTQVDATEEQANGDTLGAETTLSAEASLPTEASAPSSDASNVVISDISSPTIERGGTPGAVTATVTNHATSAASAVSIVYRLPQGVSFVPAESTSRCLSAGDLVTCSLGDMAPGASQRLSIGVGLSDPKAVVGSRSGYFFAPRTAGFDPAAGEIRQRTWHHEAGRETTPLLSCWPVQNPSPNMDIADGTCDGVNDADPLPADADAVLDAFPGPFAEAVAYSWQWETTVFAPKTGRYKVCSSRLDDGAYFAIAPSERSLTPSDVVYELDFYGHVGRRAPIELEAGRSYQVLLRISNRGGDGIDNGAAGGGLGGWGTIDLVADDATCSATPSGAFGTSASAWLQTIPAPVSVVAARTWALSGLIESAPVSDAVKVSVRFSPLRTPVEAPKSISVGSAPNEQGGAVFAPCDTDAAPAAAASCGVVRTDAGAEAIVSFMTSALEPERELFIRTSDETSDAGEHFAWAPPAG